LGRGTLCKGKTGKILSPPQDPPPKRGPMRKKPPFLKEKNSLFGGGTLRQSCLKEPCP